MFTKRALNQHLRTPADILFDIILMSIVGYVLGVAYGKIRLFGRLDLSDILAWSRNDDGNFVLRIFGNERIIFWREAVAGWASVRFIISSAKTYGGSAIIYADRS